MASVGVDFDGVIHAYSKGWQDGSIYDEPVHGALDALRTLMAKCAVFVHTTRQPEQVAGWLRARDLPAMSLAELRANGEPVGTFWDRQDRLLVTDRKLPAVAYIDDRGIRFTSWPEALAQLFIFEGIDATGDPS